MGTGSQGGPCAARLCLHGPHPMRPLSHREDTGSLSMWRLSVPLLCLHFRGALTSRVVSGSGGMRFEGKSLSGCVGVPARRPHAGRSCQGGPLGPAGEGGHQGRVLHGGDSGGRPSWARCVCQQKAGRGPGGAAAGRVHTLLCARAPGQVPLPPLPACGGGGFTSEGAVLRVSLLLSLSLPLSKTKIKEKAGCSGKSEKGLG